MIAKEAANLLEHRLSSFMGCTTPSIEFSLHPRPSASARMSPLALIRSGMLSMGQLGQLGQLGHHLSRIIADKSDGGGV